ncbi:MAG: hypothetical protein OEZ06_00790 [Myxococcales bacterium]|nr:hypothetical protein [Myxococcales bacterium]
MQRSSATEWAKRVERWNDSGLAAKAFAAETGLKASTLTYWKWRLNRERNATSPSPSAPACASSPTLPRRPRGQRRSKTTQRLPTLLEIPAVAVMSTPATLELVVSAKRRVRVPVGFDEDTLRRLLGVLETAQ